MSATLTWFNSGLQAKTGTTAGALFTDLLAMFNSRVADANFYWEVASSNIASTPFQITLRPKGGAVGRILLVMWTSAPAGNNAAILQIAPTANALYLSFFPSGNVDTPSNLSAASGTILGDDTNVIKVGAGLSLASIYAASIQPFYFDAFKCIYLGFANPAGTTLFMAGAGDLCDDSAGSSVPAVLSYSNNSAAQFGSSTSPCAWVAASVLAGGVTTSIRTNYLVPDNVYFHAYAPSGPWATQASGPTDVLKNVSTQNVAFVAMPLIGQRKLEGSVLKLRQVGIGPSSTGAFEIYNTTGPVVDARQFCPFTGGANACPWFTNFQI